jgi:hypothetical protein
MKKQKYMQAPEFTQKMNLTDRGVKLRLTEPLIGYKKVTLLSEKRNNIAQKAIAHLVIPAGTMCVFHGGGNSRGKHRAQKAFVTKLTTIKGVELSSDRLAFGTHALRSFDEVIDGDQLTIYQKGFIAYPNGFDGDIYDDCTRGLHFFTELSKAVKW